MWNHPEIADLVRTSVTPEMFAKRYGAVFEGDEKWRAMGKAKASLTYRWNSGSTYVQNPPYFEGLEVKPAPIGDVIDARVLGLFQDSITTDHISPAGSIKRDGPAGVYLIEHQVRPSDFNSYGARRGNHDVMMRGTFANVRIKNLMVPPKADGARIEGIQPAPVAGLWEVRYRGQDGVQILYSDAAGRYIVQGRIFELASDRAEFISGDAIGIDGGVIPTT